VVVVSAIGRQGDPYATDTLANLVKQANWNSPGRELDILMSCGEVISGVIMTATLQSMDCPAVF
jgi:aspartate kinase